MCHISLIVFLFTVLIIHLIWLACPLWLLQWYWNNEQCERYGWNQIRYLFEIWCQDEYFDGLLYCYAIQATSRYLNQWRLVYWRIYASLGLNELRSNDLHKMATILQIAFSNTFSSMDMFEFWLKFHGNLFLNVQSTISHDWFRWGLAK